MSFCHVWVIIALTATQPATPIAIGISQYHQGEFEASIRTIQGALEGDLSSDLRARGFLFIGLSHSVLGAWEQAREAFKQALITKPDISPNDRRIAPHIMSAFVEVRENLKGTLRVRAEIPSRVFVDGVPSGLTPVSVQMTVGKHTVRVRSLDERYESDPQEVIVGLSVESHVEPRLLLRDGMLSLHSHPTGAEVTIDGRPVGRTPLEDYLLPAGDVVVRLTAPGYQEKRLELEVSPTQPLELNVVLALSELLRNVAPPSFGFDLREGVDFWTVNVGFTLMGWTPVESKLQPIGAPSALRSGVQFGFELGVALGDFIQVAAVLGLGSFGFTESYLATVAPTMGETQYKEGTGFYRAVRMGSLVRVTIFRVGDWRPFAGTGFVLMLPMGSVQHQASESDEGNDGYLLSSKATGQSVLLLLGTKYTLLERVSRSSYFALELMLEGRVEFNQWSLDTQSDAESNEGLLRGRAAEQVWDTALSGHSSTSLGLSAHFGIRF